MVGENFFLYLDLHRGCCFWENISNWPGPAGMVHVVIEFWLRRYLAGSCSVNLHRLCIGVGSGGARGRLAPPKFQVGGASPPNFTHFT